MPLARAPMLFVTVAQEKRDFKIFVILITAWSWVQVLDGPPYSSYSNPILYEKGFGYVFCLSEVLRLRQQQTPQWGV